MAESSEYLTSLKDAVKAKNDWLNSDLLPKTLDNYRLLHTCVKNLYEVLVKKSLITPDPYKLEAKISDITCPEESPYIENERSLVIGARFSNYESMLDFVCTYIKFSAEFITIPRIKKLIDLTRRVGAGENTYYVIFSRSGFLETTKTAANAIKNIVLISLDEVVSKN